MFLSIIIPIYNVEEYIDGTLASIYSQQMDYALFEVIAVNDGTPDRSMDIVKRYAMRYVNLKIINQDNLGLSCARNTGLKAAKGKYVWFVDSDDQIAPNALRIIQERIGESDIEVVLFTMMRISESSGNKQLEYPLWCQRQKPGQVFTGQQATYCGATGAVQRCIFNRQFLLDNYLIFLPKVLYEDTELMIRLYCLACRIVWFPDITYHYLIRQKGSIMTGNVKMKNVRSGLMNIAHWEEFIHSCATESWQKRWININIFRESCWILSVSRKNKESKIVDFYNEYKWKILKSMMRNIFASKQYVKPRDCIMLFKIIIG